MKERKISVLGASRLFPWFVCGLGALFYAYEYFLRISPSVMTADLMRSFDVNAHVFGRLIGLYYFAYAPAQLLVGILMDRYGPRRILTFACLLCALGAYFFAHSQNLVIIGASRFLVGFGSAFAFVGVLKLATIWLPPERFAMVAGMASALGTLAGMFGEVAMTLLVQALGWRASVVTTAILGFVLAAILFVFIRDHNPLTAVNGNTSYDEDKDFSHLLPNFLKILSNPQIWIVGLIGCLIYLPTTVFAELWGNSFFQSVYHLGQDQAALAVSAIFLGFTIGAPFNGWLSDKIKQRRIPLVVGGLLGAFVMFSVIYIPMQVTTLYIAAFFLGFFYSAQVLVFAIGREISPLNVAGSAIAVTNMLVMFGGMIFQPMVGKLLDYGWDGVVANSVHVFSVTDYQHALTLVPVGMILSVLLVFCLKESYSYEDGKPDQK